MFAVRESESYAVHDSKSYARRQLGRSGESATNNVSRNRADFSAQLALHEHEFESNPDTSSEMVAQLLLYKGTSKLFTITDDDISTEAGTVATAKTRLSTISCECSISQEADVASVCSGTCEQSWQEGVATRESKTSFACTHRIVGNQPLGSGGYGMVWRCVAFGKQEQFHKASKRIKTAALPALVRQSVYNEVQIHGTLSHPHIVQLHGVYCDYKNKPNEIVSLVLELCLGGDLFDHVCKTQRGTGRGLPECDTARVLQHVLLALDFLHERRIVHRDVRCENVLLVQQDLPLNQTTFKLSDFGLAACVPDEGKMYAYAGLPATTAPEILAGLSYGVPVDMWSIGVLLFSVLAAMGPFMGKGAQEIANKVKRGTFSFEAELWCGISNDVKDLIRRLLTVDPDARLSAASALQDVWLLRHADPANNSMYCLSSNDDAFAAASTSIGMHAVEHLSVAARRAKGWRPPSGSKGQRQVQQKQPIHANCFSGALSTLFRSCFDAD
jgi:serine/threonine protein kinase